jgi:drug/metabolite transporter (DMT)-like permease
VPASSLALVILAGLIHAIWNIAAKKAGGDVRFATFTGLLMALIWAPLGMWLGWDVVPTWGSVEWGFVVVSGIVHVLYYIALLRGYRKADLTIVYPLARGSGPLRSSSSKSSRHWRNWFTRTPSSRATLALVLSPAAANRTASSLNSRVWCLRSLRSMTQPS